MERTDEGEDEPRGETEGDETLLVIDDEEFVLSILSRGLKERGYRVLLAQNGREGLEILQRQAVDLVLLDLSMPIVSGRDVLAELRKANMEIKVIVFTGFAATKDQFSEVIDVVQKPLKIAELARRVRSPRRLTKKNPTSLMVNPLSP